MSKKVTRKTRERNIRLAKKRARRQKKKTSLAKNRAIAKSIAQRKKAMAKKEE